MHFGEYRIVGQTPPEGCEVWYRADDKRYANYDPFAEFEQPDGSHLAIEITRYIVLRHTPKGVRLQGWLGDEYQVQGTAIRQQAVPTIELALQDLVARKEKHVRMSELRTEQAREHLNAAKRLLEKERATLLIGV